MIVHGTLKAVRLSQQLREHWSFSTFQSKDSHVELVTAPSLFLLLLLQKLLHSHCTIETTSQLG